MKEKKLQDLTKEEIGQLFPIEISPYSKDWPDLFEQEKSLIIDKVEPGLFSQIAHFGSTSIPGLSAKDTIDMLMEVDFEETQNQKLIQQLTALGYEANWQTEGDHTHLVFFKGYTISDPKTQTYHIHAGPKNHPLWDRILFRDFLIRNPQTAKEYEKLKVELAGKFKHERVAYRIAKTDFVKAITDKAKQQLS